MTHSLDYFFYSSRIVPTVAATEVARIIRSARTFNSIHGITGILVFDGERFCQYFEGPSEAVSTLISRIQADERHVDMVTLSMGSMPGDRLFPAWSMAFSMFEDCEFFDALSDLPPTDAIRKLRSLSSTLDTA